jgi:aminotransferase
MIAKRIKKMAPSGIREFFDLVLGMPEVISLGVGEPDFITPWRIREKAITALEEGLTSYTSNKGLTVLREGIAQRLKKRYSLSYDPQEEVLITVGVSEGLDLAVRAVLEPKDCAIVVSPHYVAYPALVEMWNILSPHDTIVITDEAYEELTYQGTHFPFAALEPRARARTILLNGFSKGCAMTGFRVGYACARREIIEAMTKIHSFSMLCGPIMCQVAAVEALRADRDVGVMRREYQRRRDFVVKEFNRLGLISPLPQGAFYCFPSLKKFNVTGMEFAKRLLFEEKVAVVPGSAFGKEFDSFVRVSYANSLENLREAVIRIERFLARRCTVSKKSK